MARNTVKQNAQHSVLVAEIALLRAGINDCYRMLLSEPNTKLALDKAESMMRELVTPNAADKGPA